MTAYVERGPKIPPGTWEFDWVSSVVAEVAAYAERPSHWNGELYEQTGPAAGRYHRDGGLTISRAHVLEPARPAYTSGHSLTSDEAFAAAGATQLMVFQARLSLSEFGDDGEPGATALSSLEDQVLELAFAERFTQRYAGWVAEKLTDQALPMHSGAPAYPAYTTATEQFLRPLSATTGIAPGQLRDLVERTERTQRFAVIADRVLDHHLGGLVPDAHRSELRQYLSAPLRRRLRDLATDEHRRLVEPGWELIWGSQSAEFDGNLHAVTTHYTSWSAAHPGEQPPALPNRVLAREEDDQRGEWSSGTRDLGTAELQKFLGSYTGASPHTRRRDGIHPDNVVRFRSPEVE
ncbi:hypothetical protein [Kribbella sp. NPDC004875]|uniref:hypothetical protein n=1 Tax=Kribbella sp. NPDC004875 TaxID=3364107 RepID=UPI00369ED9AB